MLSPSGLVFLYSAVLLYRAGPHSCGAHSSISTGVEGHERKPAHGFCDVPLATSSTGLLVSTRAENLVNQSMVDFLVPQEKYLEAGMHIGSKTKTGSMRQFIYKAREDGLHVLDLKRLDERLRAAAKMLTIYPAERVFIVGGKDNAFKPVQKFCELTGMQALTGRFTPGRFTNPARPDFIEPSLVFAVDPATDKQAIKEASEIHVPVLSLCDTNNTLRNIDLAIPTNNKGRKAIAFALWILTREILKKQGKLASNEEFKTTPQEFES